MPLGVWTIDEILKFFREPYRQGEEGYGWDSGAAPRSSVEQAPLKLKKQIIEGERVPYDRSGDFHPSLHLPSSSQADTVPATSPEAADRIAKIKAIGSGKDKYRVPAGGVTVGDTAPGYKSRVEEGPDPAVQWTPGEIEISGLKYDPYSREVSAKDLTPEQVVKLIKIRAEAKMKGREGSLMSAPGAEPTLEDYEAAMASYGDPASFEGNVTQVQDSAALRQREMERDMWLAGGGLRVAEQLMMYPETRDDPENIAAAEALRRTSEEKMEQTRQQVGMKLLEAAKDESGLISPTAAFNYEQLTGEPIPEALRGVDEFGAREAIFDARSRVEYIAGLMSQGDRSGMASAAYRTAAIRAIAEAEEALSMGQNPNVVLAQLNGKLALAQGEVQNPYAGMNMQGSSADAYNAMQNQQPGWMRGR